MGGVREVRGSGVSETLQIVFHLGPTSGMTNSATDSSPPSTWGWCREGEGECGGGGWRGESRG